MISLRHLRTTVGALLLACTCEPLAAQDADVIDDAARDATLTSLLGTVVPVAGGIAVMSGGQAGAAGGFMILGGYLVGPGLGYFTTGHTGRGLLGVTVRGAALAGLALGVIRCYESCDDRTVQPIVLGLGIGALGVAAAAYDILEADDWVREHGVRTGLAPWIDRDGRVGVAARFALPHVATRP